MTTTVHCNGLVSSPSPRSLMILFLLAIISCTTTASPNKYSRQALHNACRRRQQSSTTSSSTTPTGTLLRWRRPTPERVSRWFPNKVAFFNHDCAGMTNPCLHISLLGTDNIQEAVTEVSSPRSSFDDTSAEDAWWPGGTSCQTLPPSHTQKGWRVLRYRRRLGRGQDCYEHVRDAALDWEFDWQGKGILSVHHAPVSVAPRERHDVPGTGIHVVHTASYGDGDLYAPPASRNVLQVWSGPGGRRLATYMEFSLGHKLKWAPKLHAINPVTVVYDLVDQRGPGTTYTSSAYATLQGHWLQGEERVTVAHRDQLGYVDVEILSYSRPTGWGRWIWPIVRPMQRNFFESQMKALERVATSTPTRHHPSASITMDVSTVGDETIRRRR